MEFKYNGGEAAEAADSTSQVRDGLPEGKKCRSVDSSQVKEGRLAK